MLPHAAFGHPYIRVAPYTPPLRRIAHTRLRAKFYTGHPPTPASGGREQYATILGIPFIYGATPESERSAILGTFRVNPLVNCIGLSKVGDTSIDIPEANVIIQVGRLQRCLGYRCWNFADIHQW